MRDNEYEWDDEKADANLKKHNISFETARRVFDDDGSISDDDPSSSVDEDRYFIIGVVEGRVLTVIFTYRDDRTRIISARPATKIETDDYYRG